MSNKRKASEQLTVGEAIESFKRNRPLFDPSLSQTPWNFSELSKILAEGGLKHGLFELLGEVPVFTVNPPGEWHPSTALFTLVRKDERWTIIEDNFTRSIEECGAYIVEKLKN